MIQSRCFRLVVQIQRRADKIHQLDAERLSALTPAVLEGFRMRNYTVLSLIQLSKSIGNQGLAKAIPQERIKTTCMVLSRVAGGRSILGYCELRIIWLSDNIISSGPQPLTDVSREYLRVFGDNVSRTSWASSPSHEENTCDMLDGFKHVTLLHPGLPLHTDGQL